MKQILKILIFFCFTKSSLGQNFLSPEKAVQAALQNSPVLKAAAFDLKAKKYGEKASLNLPYPEVNAESPTGEFYTIGVSQAFEFPTVYTRQKQAAKAETNLALAGQRVSENELHYTVRALYLEAQVSDYKSVIWRTRDTLYQQITASATRQFEAGEIDFLQKTIVENEGGKVHQERIAAEMVTTGSLVLLNKLTGLDDMGDLEPLTSDSTEFLFLVNDMVLESPSITYQQQAVEVSKQQIALAKSRALPNFSLGYMNQGARNSPIDYRFRASVGVPLWTGQYQAGQNVAKAESQAVMARAEAESQAIERERQKVVIEALTASSKVKYFEKEGLTRSLSLITAAKRMREAGQIDFIVFLRTLDEAYLIQMEYADQLYALYSARLKRQYLSGSW